MKSSSIAVAILIISVVCYFAFPIALVFPLTLVFGPVPPAGVHKVIQIIFKPIIMIGDAFPPYRIYLMWQERLITMR